uniref:Alpha-1D adrenergic receptor-like n=1 Tax=Scleropages formosus TaxID=113540 RepID=A0A8C9SHE9_SCLFO
GSRSRSRSANISGVRQLCIEHSLLTAYGILTVEELPTSLLLGAFILFAAGGNALVILSVLCNRRLRTVTNVFIVNLAVADLLLSVVVLPFSASLEVLGCWSFGRLFCDIWAAVDVLCCTASILSLCVISVDRYIGVKHSLKYPSIMTEKRAAVILVGVWTSSAVVSVGPLLGWKEPPPADDSICSITEDPGYALFSSLFSFYLPLAVIVVMYCRIYVVARRTTKGLQAGVKKEGGKSMEVLLRIHRRSVLREAELESQGKAHPLRSSISVRLMKFSREKKAAKTLAIVVGVFILCWLPFFFVFPLGSLFPTLKPSARVFKVIFWLGYFNSCVNPIIYPCSSKEFKHAFIQLLRCQCHQRRSSWRKFNEQRWAVPVGRPRTRFSIPEPLSPSSSFLQKTWGRTLSFRGWSLLAPLQRSSVRLREKISSLSHRIKNGHAKNSAQILSKVSLDSISAGVFSDLECRNFEAHDVTEYCILEETDL